MIREVTDRLALDLRGATLLTEAATNAYASTAVIAAIAGARVVALAADSPYGSARRACEAVASLAEASSVRGIHIEFITERAEIPQGVDIVTNLGAVRPIDASMLRRLSEFGVLSYMCEAWELREGDVDLDFADSRHIPAAGVWEDYGSLNVFRTCGVLATKLCLDAGLEVSGNRILVLSSDRFGDVIRDSLSANLATVSLLSASSQLRAVDVQAADALILADYSARGSVLPAEDGPSPEQLALWNRDLLIIQFAGKADADRLREAGLTVIPPKPLPPRRMAFTLAHLGSRPVVMLHAAGLKVGEVLWRARQGVPVHGTYRSLVQPMNASAEALMARAAQ